MTRLELAICEAENNGEIDICTRDMMLEATAMSRRADRCREEAIKQVQTISRLEAIIDKSKKEDSPEVYRRIKKAAEAQISRLEEKLNDHDGPMQKYSRMSKDPTVAAHELGREAAVMHRRAFSKKSFDQLKDKGIEMGDAKRRRYPDHDDRRKAGRYKTTNGLKESVLEEIYEAELNGDITPEERMSLIEYMDY